MKPFVIMLLALVAAYLFAQAVPPSTVGNTVDIWINVSQLGGSGLAMVGGKLAVDTSMITAIATDQSGVSKYCNSINGTSGCTCTLSGARLLTQYTPGMTLLLNSNSACSTLDVDSVGLLPLTKKDGTLPAGNIPGQAQLIWFDGKAMRLMY